MLTRTHAHCSASAHGHRPLHTHRKVLKHYTPTESKAEEEEKYIKKRSENETEKKKRQRAIIYESENKKAEESGRSARFSFVWAANLTAKTVDLALSPHSPPPPSLPPTPSFSVSLTCLLLCLLFSPFLSIATTRSSSLLRRALLVALW